MGESGVAGLQIETRLPGGTLCQPSISQKTSFRGELKLTIREQPRRTASYVQPDDP
jgi:hypothetical protein